MYERIYSYLNKNKILTPVQFGFKQNFSTSDAVRQLFDNFAENIDQKKYTCAVFLDLKKAFDTVNHQILLAKLEKYGIRELPLQLLKSYLNNRLQFTVVNNTKSKFNHVTCGVPQGFTLGPLLFLLYINDMPLVSNFNTKLFADDTFLTQTNSCPKLLNKNVNSELVKIEEWLKLNKLSLSAFFLAYISFLWVRRKNLNIIVVPLTFFFEGSG